MDPFTNNPQNIKMIKTLDVPALNKKTKLVRMME